MPHTQFKTAFDPCPSAFIRGWLLLALVVMATVGGCAEETTVISESGPLMGLPGAERGGKPVKAGGSGMNPLETVPDSELIKTTPTVLGFILADGPTPTAMPKRKGGMATLGADAGRDPRNFVRKFNASITSLPSLQASAKGQGSINVNSWAPDSRRIAYVKYVLHHK